MSKEKSVGLCDNVDTVLIAMSSRLSVDCWVNVDL